MSCYFITGAVRMRLAPLSPAQIELIFLPDYLLIQREAELSKVKGMKKSMYFGVDSWQCREQDATL